MHESIVRTEEQIKKHLDKLAALADTKDTEVAQNNFIMHAVLTTFLNSDAAPQGMINSFDTYTSTQAKLLTDLCLWLTGKFNNAPTYNPLREPQFSVEQVLEDFGKTDYTEFNIG